MKAGVNAVNKAVEYLINAELAVIQLSKDIRSAEKRNRVDLKIKYVSQLSELVNFVPYSEVIEKT